MVNLKQGKQNKREQRTEKNVYYKIKRNYLKSGMSKYAAKNIKGAKKN